MTTKRTISLAIACTTMTALHPSIAMEESQEIYRLRRELRHKDNQYGGHGGKREIPVTRSNGFFFDNQLAFSIPEVEAKSAKTTKTSKAYAFDANASDAKAPKAKSSKVYNAPKTIKASKHGRLLENDISNGRGWKLGHMNRSDDDLFSDDHFSFSMPKSKSSKHGRLLKSKSEGRKKDGPKSGKKDGSATSDDKERKNRHSKKYRSKQPKSTSSSRSSASSSRDMSVSLSYSMSFSNPPTSKPSKPPTLNPSNPPTSKPTSVTDPLMGVCDFFQSYVFVAETNHTLNSVTNWWAACPDVKPPGGSEVCPSTGPIMDTICQSPTFDPPIQSEFCEPLFLSLGKGTVIYNECVSACMRYVSLDNGGDCCYLDCDLNSRM